MYVLHLKKNNQKIIWVFINKLWSNLYSGTPRGWPSGSLGT
jgi:hypothetical protein